jgi:MOSC domain-containing protein YiiM
MRVIAVARDGKHRFSKVTAPEVRMVAGLGVEGDAHAGETVRHRSRVAVDPGQPNLRQVHLIHGELFDELRPKGFDLEPGQLGENVTTQGIDLIGLARSTLLALGPQAVLEVTGLRNPCAQIEAFRPGLLAAVCGRGLDGKLVRKAGIMAIVRAGGVVRRGDAITLTLPPPPHHPLERV